METKREKENSDGHTLSEFFMELPSADDYPDYYRVIASPMSLAEIRSKIKRGEYQNNEGMTQDVQTMIANAKHYNEESSDVWKDADALFKVYAKLADREDLLSDADHQEVSSVTYNKDTFHVGDCIAFQYEEDPAKRPNVGVIVRLWKSESYLEKILFLYCVYILLDVDSAHCLGAHLVSMLIYSYAQSKRGIL